MNFFLLRYTRATPELCSSLRGERRICQRVHEDQNCWETVTNFFPHLAAPCGYSRFCGFKLMLCATSPLASCVCVYEWMNVSRILPPPLGHQRTLNPGCFNYSSMRSAHLRLPSSTCSENLIFRLMSLNFLHFFHGISDQIWNEARPCEKSFNLNGQGENTIWDGGVDKKNLWLGGNNLVFSALRSGNAPLTCSYENQKYALVFVFGVFFSPSLPISGEEEMEGVGVGQRPEGGNQKDYHKFTWSKLSVSYAVSLEICVE